MRGILLRSIGALVALLIVSGAQAATIFSQTLPSGSGLYSDANKADRPLYAAEDFILSQTSRISSVSWRGYNRDNIALEDNFTIVFFSDSSGPDSILATFASSGIGVTKTAAGSYYGETNYIYEFDLASAIELSSGEKYWISIFNESALVGGGYRRDRDAWVWGGIYTTADALLEPAMYSEHDLNSWTAQSAAGGHNDLYFELYGSVVPVPAAIWLFGSSLGILGWLRHKAA